MACSFDSPKTAHPSPVAAHPPRIFVSLGSIGGYPSATSIRYRAVSCQVMYQDFCRLVISGGHVITCKRYKGASCMIT